jgi:hypothetical protein
MAKPITPESLAASGTEDGEQMALFCHAQRKVQVDWRWGLLFAIPNGGKRGVATASRLVATGVKRGVPDVCLPMTQRVKTVETAHIMFYFSCPGLYIELKRIGDVNKQPGKISEAQKYWREVLRGQGYQVHVAYGWQQAADQITHYLLDCPP